MSDLVYPWSNLIKINLIYTKCDPKLSSIWSKNDVFCSSLKTGHFCKFRTKFSLKSTKFDRFSSNLTVKFNQIIQDLKFEFWLFWSNFKFFHSKSKFARTWAEYSITKKCIRDLDNLNLSVVSCFQTRPNLCYCPTTAMKCQLSLEQIITSLA